MQLSTELKALLEANDIPLERPEGQDYEEQIEELRRSHRDAVSNIFRQIQQVNSPNFSSIFNETDEAYLRSNPAEIAKLRDMVHELEAADAKLQAALETDLFRKASEATSSQWEYRHKLRNLYTQLQGDYERRQYTASHRLTQAFKELRDRGFVAKQAGRLGNLIEGVPAVWPMEAKDSWAWDFFTRATHDSEGELTAAGKALEATLTAWSIQFEYYRDRSDRLRLRISLDRSDSLPLPDEALMAELANLIDPQTEEVAA